MDRFDRSFHRFSLLPSLACPATRWVVLTSLSALQHVGFVSINKVELSWRKVSDWQAVKLHRQSNSRYTCPSFEVILWCCFWSRSCVISVSTDSQKKLKKNSCSTKTSWTLQAWWKSSESVDLRRVYGNPTCTILFVDLPSSNMRSPNRYCDDWENTWCWAVRYFSSAAWSSRHTDNHNARLWMVSRQKRKQKKRARRNGRKLPIEWSAWSLRRDHCWALTRERKWLWQSTRSE